MLDSGCGVDYGTDAVLKKLDSLVVCQRADLCESDNNAEVFEFSKQIVDCGTVPKLESVGGEFSKGLNAFMNYRQHISPAMFSPQCPYSINQVPKQNISNASLSNQWLAEFKNENGEHEELRRSAREILDSLSHDRDPKLQSSRFLAYIKRLSCDLNVGQENLKESISRFYNDRIDVDHPTGSIDGWAEMEKSWQTFQASGYGYDGWAAKYFGEYLTSNKVSDISKLEEKVDEDPLDPIRWYELGLAHQANENDAKAIPALERSIRLGNEDNMVYLAIASSLANECCVPEATRYLRSGCLRMGLKLGDSSAPMDILNDLSRFANDKDEKIFKQTAMCIMSSLVGNYERASMALQTIAGDTPDWITLNRLGASLANGGNYEEALATYSRIPLENQCPRVLYNRGIALMCTDKLSESKSVFIKALIELSRHDTIEGSIIWDALELASELSGDSLVSGFVAAKDINNLMMIENL